MSFKIKYIGQDLAFTDLLNEVAQSLHLQCKHLLPKNSHKSIIKNSLVIIDHYDFPHLDETFLSQIQKKNTVLIAHSDDVPLLPLPVEVSQAISKNVPFSQLQAELSAHIPLEKKQEKKPQPKDNKELIKENKELTKTVKNLENLLKKVGQDLTRQEETIEVIEHISQLSHQINCLDMAHIASVCIEQVPDLISARFASLYRLDPDKNVLHLLQHNHPFSIARVMNLAEHPFSPMSLAVKKRKILLIKDFKEWEMTEDVTVKRIYTGNYHSNSCIIAPLVSGDKILGILNLADKTNANHFQRNVDIPPIRLLCDIIGSAISNIELYEEVQKRADRDGMTGLLNHRAFYALLDKEVNRAIRYKNDLSLMMIDLDNLKTYNDTYGHLAGDTVLIHVADKIKQGIREIDIAARYGGDEFSVILPNTSLEDAQHLANRILELITNESVTINGESLAVSASIGLGQYRTSQSLEDFMNESDAALFEAKTSGKNRLHVHH